MHTEQNALALLCCLRDPKASVSAGLGWSLVPAGVGWLCASRVSLLAQSEAGSDGRRVRAGVCLTAPQCDGRST